MHFYRRVAELVTLRGPPPLDNQSTLFVRRTEHIMTAPGEGKNLRIHDHELQAGALFHHWFIFITSTMATTNYHPPQPLFLPTHL
jgi:hypothetical protein